MKVRLSVQHRKANVKTVVLHSDAVIGRSTECNLRLASGQVSRKHCQLFIDDVRVAVMDLGSSNGTFLNGNQLEANIEVPLPHGAELEIGPVRFTVEYDDPNADTSIRRRAAGEAPPGPEEMTSPPKEETPETEPPPEPKRPLLVAKAARKKPETQPEPEADPLAETVRPDDSPAGVATPAEADAQQLFSPSVTDPDDEDDAPSETGDSDSRPNLEGSADETAEGFSLNFKPGGVASPHEETLRVPPESPEDNSEDDLETPAGEDDAADKPEDSSDDNFMDFLKNLDE